MSRENIFHGDSDFDEIKQLFIDELKEYENTPFGGIFMNKGLSSYGSVYNIEFVLNRLKALLNHNIDILDDMKGLQKEIIEYTERNAKIEKLLNELEGER